MTLQDRARALSRARPADSLWRHLVAAVSIGVILAGALVGPLWLAVPGAFALGLTFARDPERYYLEGFSDGLAAAAVQPAGPAGQPRRDAPDVDELPAGAGDDGLGARRDRAAIRPSDRGLREAAAADGVADLAGAFGVQLGTGPARPALDADGRPLPADRPRRPAAVAHEPERDRLARLAQQNGTAPGTEARPERG